MFFLFTIFFFRKCKIVAIHAFLGLPENCKNLYRCNKRGVTNENAQSHYEVINVSRSTLELHSCSRNRILYKPRNLPTENTLQSFITITGTRM